jgi:hypothetical protein
MIYIIVKIMVEQLSTLAMATKLILKQLIGKTGIEVALKRLDKLANEEVRMATAQVLRPRILLMIE